MALMLVPVDSVFHSFIIQAQRLFDSQMLPSGLEPCPKDWGWVDLGPCEQKRMRRNNAQRWKWTNFPILFVGIRAVWIKWMAMNSGGLLQLGHWSMGSLRRCPRRCAKFVVCFKGFERQVQFLEDCYNCWGHTLWLEDFQFSHPKILGVTQPLQSWKRTGLCGQGLRHRNLTCLRQLVAANGSAVGRILHFYACTCTGDVGNICAPRYSEGTVLHSFILSYLHASTRYVLRLAFMLCFIRCLW